MTQTLSELELLETDYAPCTNKRQCIGRISNLESKIASIWEFITIASKLDPAMRIALLNYLETPFHPIDINVDINVDIEDAYLHSNQNSIEEEEDTEDKTEYIKTLSPKKSSKKKTKTKRVQKHVTN